jgi:hypothetical protein
MAAKKKPKGSRKKKFDLVSYVQKNKVNSAIAAILIIFLLYQGWNYLTSSSSGPGQALPTTTQPRHIPGKNYITSGEWYASKFDHDLGHAGLNQSWESTKDGFGYLLSRNYVDILEGSYTVTFTMKVDNNTIKDSRKVATIEVAQNMGIPVGNRDLFVQDFKEAGAYQDFTLRLDARDPLNDAELRVHYDMGPVTVNVLKVTLKQIV